MRPPGALALSPLTLTAALVGCAARGPSAQVRVQQSRADGLVSAGCHACSAEFRTIIADAEQQAATAAYNAGHAYARSNNRDAALAKLAVAARHAAMKDKAEALSRLLAPR